MDNVWEIDSQMLLLARIGVSVQDPKCQSKRSMNHEKLRWTMLGKMDSQMLLFWLELESQFKTLTKECSLAKQEKSDHHSWEIDS